MRAAAPAATSRLPLSAVSAGIMGTIIGFGGTVALVVEALRTVRADDAEIVSGVTALCLGIGVCTLLLSFWTRMPVVCAWSTPGAALVGASGAGTGYANALGAFILAAAAMVVLGLIPALERGIERIPPSLAAAMLAGVLLPYGLGVFKLLGGDPLLVGLLLAVFILFRQRLPAYALLLVLGAAVAVLAARGQIPALGLEFGRLVPAALGFDWHVAISLAMPLFLVTLASQNLPGLAVLRADGYAPRAQPMLLATGLGWLAMAPFGAPGINLAAIIAAICTGPDAHPDPGRRWLGGMVYGAAYLVLALFATPLVLLFTRLPHEAVLAIAGIALVAPLSNALSVALARPEGREPAILTFLTTASGLALFGIGSAFWGLVCGFLVLGAKKLLTPRA